MIIRAAIKGKNGKIITGRRHYECFDGTDNMKYGIQGFIDHNGVFYTREEALVYVIENNQLTEPLISFELSSEDLW